LKSYSWPFWRDFWGPKMFQNLNFPGLRPGPRWGSLQCSPDFLSEGLAAPCQEPDPRSRPFGPRVYGSQFVFFGFGERTKWTRWWMDRSGQCPSPHNFWARTASDSCVSRARSSSVSILSILQYMKTKKKTVVIITLVLWLWAWCLQCICTCMCAFQSKQD